MYINKIINNHTRYTIARDVRFVISKAGLKTNFEYSNGA